jgi:hypothetical protein
MRRIMVLSMLVGLIVPIAGCLETEETELHCGCCDHYLIEYTYSGLYVYYEYNSINIEEPVLVESLMENLTLNRTGGTYSDPGGTFYNKYLRPGTHSFQLFNEDNEEFDDRRVLILTVNEFITAPGYGDSSSTYGDWNIFCTNISLTFHVQTISNTTGMNSTDMEMAEALSDEIYEQDLKWNEDWIEKIDTDIILIFGNEPYNYTISRSSHYEYMY